MKPNLFILNRFNKKCTNYLQLSLFVSFLFTIHLASAQVKYVTQNGAGTKDGTSWSNAFGSTQLFVALSTANSNSQFWIAAGTYLTKTTGVSNSRSESFLIKSGVSVYGGFAGTETTLTQRNINAHVTILSGNINDPNSSDDNNYHVVLFDNVTSPALIDGITIKYGNANESSTPATERGGGIFIMGGQNNVQVQNCILSNNNAHAGGAMFIGGTGSPMIKSCTITNNSAETGAGMAIISEDDANISATFSQVFFTNNTYSGDGDLAAAAFIQTESGSTNTNYINCVFANSTTSGGNVGGIFAVSFVGSCNINVTNCTFFNNGNNHYNGGNAITCLFYVTGTITNSIFWNNNGGDIKFSFNTVTISNNIVQNGSWGGWGPNNSNANPQFVNTANIAGTDALLGTTDDGLNILCNSPALNSGTATGAPAIDITGTLRPQGAGIDLGAYEVGPRLLSVSIAASENNICSIAPVTFTATPVNAGINPTYQWKKNGVNVGTNSAAYTNNSWINQDVISCTITSNETCLNPNTANSNSITMIVSNLGIIYVKANATGANNGKSWTDAFVSLQSAFNQVSICTSQIWVAKGVYKPTQNTGNNGSGPTDVNNTFKLPLVSVYGGFIGNETSLSQRNIFKNLTILSGDLDNNDINTDGNYINENPDNIQGNNAYNVVHINGSPTPTSLDGFVITGGNANVDDAIRDERVRNNKGGGMFIANVGGNFSMANCMFIGNSSRRFGGGIVLIEATIILDNCIFINNRSNLGGGVYTYFTTLTLNNSILIDNYAGSGGGGLYGAVGTSGTANHCTFYNNSTSGAGGGVALLSTTSYDLKNSILWNNAGGNIYNTPGFATVFATYCNVEGYSGTGNINANPLFQSTTDWDGPDNIWATADDGLMLLSNSPGKDTGTSSGLLKDIRGISRPYNSIADMGAYEYTPQLPTPSISITASNSYLCESGNVIFTAIPDNIADLNPTYQWKKNGNNVGTNALTYEGNFNVGDVVTCEMNIPSPFQTIISNSITLTAAFPNNIIYVDAAAPEGNVGNSWANALNSLQSAINAAANCTNVTQIWVKSGTYYPSAYAYGAGLTIRDRAFGLKDNLAIYGSFAGTETTLTQRNIPNNPTILSGDIGTSGDNTDNCYHVVVSPNNNNTAILDGFIIKDGNANGSETIEILGKSVYQYGGGGVFATYSLAQFNNCIIQQSNAYTHGGGVYLDFGSPLFNNTVFTDNHVSTGNGGGFFAYSSSFIASNCVFENNNTGGLGGGLYQLYSNSSIRNSTFYNNTATTDGGGIYHDNSAATIINCIVWGNHGGGTQGIKGINNGPFVSYSTVQGGFSGTGNSSSDPLFLSNDVDGVDNKWRTADDGLQLACGSPAINTASSIEGVITDIIGISRPQDGSPDRGAYEKTNNTSTPTVAGNTTIHVGQNTILTANGCVSGSIKWYGSATATSAITTNNPLNILPVSSLSYYVSCTLNSCESSRLLVQITVNPNPCLDNPTIANYTAGSRDIVQSQNIISASNNIETDANITYKATKSVTLLPGFKVSSGAVFKAVIGACN